MVSDPFIEIDQTKRLDVAKKTNSLAPYFDSLSCPLLADCVAKVAGVAYSIA
jgi:hypothetical protein